MAQNAGEHFSRIHWNDVFEHTQADGSSVAYKMHELSAKCEKLESFSFMNANVLIHLEIESSPSHFII